MKKIVKFIGLTPGRRPEGAEPLFQVTTLDPNFESSTDIADLRTLVERGVEINPIELERAKQAQLNWEWRLCAA